MSAFTLSAADFRAACQAGEASAALAFSRALGETCELATGSPEPLLAERQAWQGPGIVFTFRRDEGTILAVLPAEGVLPEWCAQLDNEGQAKLNDLARDLAATLLPDSLAGCDCSATWEANIISAVEQADLGTEATAIPVQLQLGEKSGRLTLVCPAHDPVERGAQATTNVPGRASGTPSSTNQPQEASQVEPAAASARRKIQYADLEEGLQVLPPYSRSLLRIRVPVTVTLAEAKQPVQAITNIGPGSIIHFNKSCEDTLTLEISGHKIAVGETVKVGDKFGLWITSMILPDERFWLLGSDTPKRAK